MLAAKYLAIKYTEVVVPNPYWTVNNDGIESKNIKETQLHNTFLYSDKELTKFLKDNESTAKTIKYFKVEQIYPSIEVTTRLSLGGNVGAEVQGPNYYTDH
jgi:hypothetical protein